MLLLRFTAYARFCDRTRSQTGDKKTDLFGRPQRMGTDLPGYAPIGLLRRVVKSGWDDLPFLPLASQVYQGTLGHANCGGRSLADMMNRPMLAFFGSSGSFIPEPTRADAAEKARS